MNSHFPSGLGSVNVIFLSEKIAEKKIFPLGPVCISLALF